jgi:hypothetical protein
MVSSFVGIGLCSGGVEDAMVTVATLGEGDTGQMSGVPVSALVRLAAKA